MSLKKYLLLILSGISFGTAVAFLLQSPSMNNSPSATRNIASTKMARLNPKLHVGKPGAPLLVQITPLPESDPERGFYRLLAHVTFNQPMTNLRFQWALPMDSRVVEGAVEGNISMVSGEEFAEQVIDLQITDQNKDSQVLFDINYQQEGIPMGVSDLYVIPSQAI